MVHFVEMFVILYPHLGESTIRSSTELSTSLAVFYQLWLSLFGKLMDCKQGDVILSACDETMYEGFCEVIASRYYTCAVLQ